MSDCQVIPYAGTLACAKTFFFGPAVSYFFANIGLLMLLHFVIVCCTNNHKSAEFLVGVFVDGVFPKFKLINK